MNVFSSRGADRAAQRRSDEAWLAEMADHPASRFVPVWRGQNLIHDAEPPRAVLLPRAELERGAAGAAPWILLGEHEEGALFAVEVEAPAEPAWPGDFADLRRFGALLEPREAALLAQARAMVHWHRRHRFCGDCGDPTQSADAGYRRACTNPACAAQHFPRTDPAVIVLVTHENRCLLARQASWAERVYAVLAGFVEPGESLEDAVAREVREETGLELCEVRYHSSQPWPFPASLMAGFTATAVRPDLRLDTDELEDARWFARAELEDALRSGEVLLPSRASIAYALLSHWLGSPRDPADPVS